MSDPPSTGQTDSFAPRPLTGPWRYVFLTLGVLMVALGAIGIFLPVMPTAPFLIVALWAFSRSSRRLHNWLYTHPTLSPYVKDWAMYRVIPPLAKIWAVSAMFVGWLMFTLLFAWDMLWPIIIAVVEILVSIYILTRRSYPPGKEPQKHLPKA